MKINKDSWHYKFLNNATVVFGERIDVMFDPWHQYTLCNYLELILSKIFRIFGFALLLISIAVIVWCMVLLPILQFLDVLTYFVAVVGLLGWLLLLIGIVFYTIAAIQDYCAGQGRFRDNLVSHYIKAKKEKYCPIIEFVEKE